MSKTHSSAATFYGTFMAILMLIAVLVFVDLMLVRVDRNEREQDAQSYFDAGQEYVAQQDYDSAVDSFRSAFSIDRENRRFQLAYAEALYRADRIAEAEGSARDLLDSDPTNADASLIMARILTGKTGDVVVAPFTEVSRLETLEEGISFYHRAIFGRWEDDAAERRLQTRLELADLLAETRANEELLAELLPLRDVAIGNLDLTRRIAGLYIEAGSPERAAELYREILQESPEDAGALAGIGEAEFAQSNYRTASRSFETALRYAPNDAGIKRRLEVTNQVLDLDPMGRGLSAGERYTRSLMLLEMTRESLAGCVGPDPDYLTITLSAMADTNLERKVSVADYNDAFGENLDLAEQIWDLRLAACGEPNDADEPIALVLTRAAQ